MKDNPWVAIRETPETVPILSPELSVRTFEALTGLMKSRLENPSFTNEQTADVEKREQDEQRLYRMLLVRIQHEVLIVKIADNAPHP